MAEVCSPEQAAAELLKRRRARATLVDYSQSIEIPGAPISETPDEWLFQPIETSVAKHHIVIMEAVEKCIRTDYGRLIILAPPGSAKSSYAAVVAPTWAMGAFPGIRVLMTSYSSTPIIRASKRARQICSSYQYQGIFKTGIVAGSNAADEWELTNGSGLFACGLFGGITSSRCDLGVIDDPVAGREEAESQTMRSKTRNAYQDDFLSRLKPKASLILITTRWHQDDLAGSILPDDYDGSSGSFLCRDGQTWEVLCIPAQCDSDNDPLGRELGDYLWPEWFSPRHWAMYKANSRTWSSLYQQKPVPEKGIYCQREQFQRYSKAPDGIRWTLCSDFATKQDAGDKTAHTIFGLDSKGGIWIDGGFNERVTTDKGVAAGVDLVDQYKPMFWIGEKGVIENAIGPEVRNQMRKRRVYAVRKLLPPSGDKLAKCQGFLGHVEVLEVHVRDCPFGDELIDQLCGFPGATFDDIWDTCGMFGRVIDMVMEGDDPDAKEERDQIVPFTRKWLEMDNYDQDNEAARARFYR